MTTEDRKVAFITGAASGIGRATAHLFADEGARVAVTDVALDGVSRVVEEIRQTSELIATSLTAEPAMTLSPQQHAKISQAASEPVSFSPATTRTGRSKSARGSSAHAGSRASSSRRVWASP